MAKLRTLRCRFSPSLPTRELKTWHVHVKWWAFDDDRLGARGDAKLDEARIVVRAQDAAEAKKLVAREWSGVASFIGRAEVDGANDMNNPTDLIGTVLNNGATVLAVKSSKRRCKDALFPFIVLCSWEGRFATWDANQSFDCLVSGDYCCTIQEGFQSFSARR